MSLNTNKPEDFLPVQKILTAKGEVIIWSLIILCSIALAAIVWASLNRII